MRSTRAQRGLNAASVAREAGISRSYLIKIEQGLVYQPGDHVIDALAATLGVPSEELRGRTAPEQVRATFLADRIVDALAPHLVSIEEQLAHLRAELARITQAQASPSEQRSDGADSNTDSSPA